VTPPPSTPARPSAPAVEDADERAARPESAELGAAAFDAELLVRVRTKPRHNKLAFPVAGNGAVGSLRGSLIDQHLGADEALAAPTRASPRHAQRPTVAQARTQSGRGAPRRRTSNAW
jgi:hypothetical protein